MTEISNVDHFAPADAISLLTNFRKEQFPFERNLALIGFSAWMRWPDDQQTISLIRNVAAAKIFLDLRGDQKDLFEQSTAASRERFAESLIQYAKQPLVPLHSLFENALRFGDEVADIASFFMLCPSEFKPSFLKAIYFIDKGGFAPVGALPTDNDFKDYKRSPASSKIAWAERAVTAPFVWTAIHLNFRYLLMLSPESGKTHLRLRKIFKNPERLISYFQHAKFCQQVLISKLHPITIKRFKFVRFPEKLMAVDPKCGSFDQDQIDVVKSYRAPQPMW